MHPILERRGRVALYLALWLLIGGLLAALLVGQGGLGWTAALLVALPLASIYSSVCTSAWYVAWSTPLATTGLLRLAGTAIGASVISSAAWMAAARGWNYILTTWIGVQADYREISGIIFGFGVLIYLLSLAVSYLAAAAVQTQAAETRAMAVQVHSREAELRSLRAQNDPHFLFNSLH